MKFFLVVLLLLVNPAFAESKKSKEDYAEAWATGMIVKTEDSPDEFLFLDHVCEGQCYGESAGYHWAIRNKERLKQDPSLCETKSASFNRGCRIYFKVFDQN